MRNNSKAQFFPIPKKAIIILNHYLENIGDHDFILDDIKEHELLDEFELSRRVKVRRRSNNL